MNKITTYPLEILTFLLGLYVIIIPRGCTSGKLDGFLMIGLSILTYFEARSCRENKHESS